MYKKKSNVIGDGVQYKVWLIVHGFEQHLGLDYIEIFALVVKWEAIRTLAAIATHNGWHIKHLDVQTTFLDGFLNEKVFMFQLEGLVVPEQEQKVCHLQHTLYGLCQSIQPWYIHINQYLHDTSLCKSDVNGSLYILAIASSIILLILYVDDLLIIGSNHALF